MRPEPADPARQAVALRLGLALLDALELAVTAAKPAPIAAPVADADGVRLLRLDEVCDRLGLGITSVKALADVELPTVRQGRYRYVRSDVVDAYIARLDAGAARRAAEDARPIDIGRRRRPTRRSASSAASPPHNATARRRR